MSPMNSALSSTQAPAGQNAHQFLPSEMSIATRPAISKNQPPSQMPSNQFGWNLIAPIASPASIENAQIGQIAKKQDRSVSRLSTMMTVEASPKTMDTMRIAVAFMRIGPRHYRRTYRDSKCRVPD